MDGQAVRCQNPLMASDSNDRYPLMRLPGLVVLGISAVFATACVNMHELREAHVAACVAEADPVDQWDYEAAERDCRERYTRASGGDRRGGRGSIDSGFTSHSPAER
jgi:hypothetical protein